MLRTATRVKVNFTFGRTCPSRLRLHRSISTTMSPLASRTAWDPNQTKYPHVRRSDTVETFKSATRGEVKVADPYDWLHDPDSQETKQFVEDQGAFTRQYLDQYKDRERFAQELKKNWNFPRCESGCDPEAHIQRPRSSATPRALSLPSPPHVNSAPYAVVLSPASRFR